MIRHTVNQNSTSDYPAEIIGQTYRDVDSYAVGIYSIGRLVSYRLNSVDQCSEIHIILPDIT